MINGFIILSHQNPHQLRRLVGILNRLYDKPPIACHHDESQSPLDRTGFPDNLVFVQPSIRTGWGKFSVVEAALAALHLLYEQANPDWFTLMSASDYPIADAAHVRADLAASSDVLIDCRQPDPEHDAADLRRLGPINPLLKHYEAPSNRRMSRGRYLGTQLWLPIVRRSASRSRFGRLTITLPFDTPFHPFTADFRCYYGDHWFTGSRKAADALLNPTARELRLRKYLRRRASADECYYQTVLCNRPDLTVQRDNRRYAQWSGGGAHPATLGCDDLDAMMTSGAHFARKFAPDDPVLDRIDDILLGRAPRPAESPLA